MASLMWRLSSMVLVTMVGVRFIGAQLTIVYSSCLCVMISLNFWPKVLTKNENPSFYFVSLSSMLRDTLLTCHMYAQFISLYRQLLTEVTMDEGRDSQVAGNFWTVWCMRNNETSCSCFWLLSCSFHKGSMGIKVAQWGNDLSCSAR